MSLFFIGIIEMLIVTTWTKVVSKSQILASGIVTFVNILIWYYVLEKITSDISNWKLILSYALGCTIGTVAITFYFQRKEYTEEIKMA